MQVYRSPRNKQFGGALNVFQSLFGGTPQNPTPPTNPPQMPAPTNPANQDPSQPLPGVSPNNPTAPNNPTPPDPTPFDGMKDIWQTPTNPNPDSGTGFFGNVDPKKLMESAQKVDFARIITPDDLTAIQGGGEAAAKAFAKSLNSVAQTVYAQSALATTKIVEQALNKAQERYDAQLPSLVTKLTANQNLVQDNPLLKHPAVQPLAEALQAQLIQKNPNATPAEIQTQVSDYFKAMATAFSPKPATVKSSQNSDTDWDAFLK